MDVDNSHENGNLIIKFHSGESRNPGGAGRRFLVIQIYNFVCNLEFWHWSLFGYCILVIGYYLGFSAYPDMVGLGNI